MDLTILPKKKIIDTYRRYSLPAEQEPTEINKLQFFYIGTQTRYIEQLKENFEFGYTAASAGDAMYTLKRLLKKADAVTIPAMIIVAGTVGAAQLADLHKFIYSHKIMADVPFLVEATGVATEELNNFKGYSFIDDLIFLHEFTAPALQRKVNFLQRMKQQRRQQPESCIIETAYRPYANAKALTKRVLDLVIASVLLALAGPLLLLVALAVKADTGGPVLVSTLRTGRAYRIFHLYKFNTNSRTGAFLRKTGMNELPQLLNVWLGDLSLAGYRALPLYEAEQLTTNANAHHFLSPAGITGWQIAKNGNKIMLPVPAPLAPATDRSDLLYDIWLMANKPSPVIQKSNA